MKTEAMLSAILMGALLFAASISLVLTRYSHRHDFIEFTLNERRLAELKVEFDRMRLEYSTLSSPDRIERIARERHGMKPVEDALLVGMQ